MQLEIVSTADGIAVAQNTYWDHGSGQCEEFFA